MLTLFRIQNKEYDQSYFNKKNNFCSRNLFFNGRQSLYFLLNRKINSNHKFEEVLLPSYCPEGLIDPIKKSKKIKHKFYKLDKNLFPDFLSLKKNINFSNKKKKLFILIHYFGYNFTSKKIRNFLKKKNITILHDLAHSFFLKKKNIQIKKDDIFLYSLNKYFPISDGAFLEPNNKFSIKFNKKNAQLRLASNFYDKHLQINSKLRNENDQKKNDPLLRKSEYFYEKYYRNIKNNLETARITKKSLTLLNKINLEKFKKQRLFNSIKIIEIIKKNKTLKQNNKRFLKLKNIVPWCIPIIVNNRKKIINYFKKKNILFSTLENKWNFIPNKKKFKNESFFIKNHILIPNNEFLGKKDIKKITNELALYHE